MAPRDDLVGSAQEGHQEEELAVGKIDPAIIDIQTRLGSAGEQLVSAETGIDPSRLGPALRDTFARLTLARRDYSERVTVDLGLAFESASGRADLPDLAVVELKQSKRAASPVAVALAEMGVSSSSLSKYCLGVAWTIRASEGR